MRTILATAMLSVVLLGGRAFAETVSRDYDVRDLLVDVPDFAIAPAVTSAPARPDRATIVANLLEALHHVDSLDAVYLTEHGGTLTAVADESSQALLSDAIESLRAARSTQVQIDCRAIAIRPADMGKLPEPLRRQLPLADLIPAGAATSADDWTEFTTTSAPRLTTFNGQTAHVAIERSRFYVKDVSVIRGKDGKVAYDPVIDELKSGLTLQTCCTASPDGSAIGVNLRVDLTTLKEMKSVGYKDAPDVKIQVPIVEKMELSRALCVGDGKSVLLRLGKGTRDGEVVYLLVTATAAAVKAK